MHGLTTYTATYEGAEYVKEAKIFLIHPAIKYWPAQRCVEEACVCAKNW